MASTTNSFLLLVVLLASLAKAHAVNTTDPLATASVSEAGAAAHNTPLSIVSAAKTANKRDWATSFWHMNVWYSGYFKNLRRAVQVAGAIPQMSILLQAVNAAGVAAPLLSSTTQWTILAPSNAAFEDLLDALKVTPEELLSNKALLTKVLSYHVIPSAALTSSHLRNGERYHTALEGTVLSTSISPRGTVRLTGANNQNVARVTVPNIRAGRSIIHVIDTVLLPPQ